MSVCYSHSNEMSTHTDLVSSKRIPHKHLSILPNTHTYHHFIMIIMIIITNVIHFFVFLLHFVPFSVFSFDSRKQFSLAITSVTSTLEVII